MLKRFPHQGKLGNNRFLLLNTLGCSELLPSSAFQGPESHLLFAKYTLQVSLTKLGRAAGLRRKVKRSFFPCLWWTSRLPKVNYFYGWGLLRGKGAKWLDVCGHWVTQPICNWSLPYCDWVPDSHWPIVGIILDPGKRQVIDAQDRVQGGWKTNS